MKHSILYPRLRATAAALALALVAAGCAVGPDYQKPQSAPVTLASPEQALFSNGQLQRDWWKQLQDPQLDRLIGLALERNHDIRIAQARLAESRAVLDERSWTSCRPSRPAAATSAACRRPIPAPRASAIWPGAIAPASTRPGKSTCSAGCAGPPRARPRAARRRPPIWRRPASWSPPRWRAIISSCVAPSSGWRWRAPTCAPRRTACA